MLVIWLTWMQLLLAGQLAPVGEQPAPIAEPPPTTQPAGGEQRATESDQPSEPQPPAALPAEGPGLELVGTPEVRIVGNQIIIEGDYAEDLDALEALIKRLDQAAAVELPDIRVFTLKKAQAAEVQKNLQRIFDAMFRAPGKRPGPADQITIVADNVSNTLIVAAAKQRFPKIEEIITQIDESTEVIGPANIMTVRLKHTLAAEAAEKLRKMLQALKKSGGVTQEMINIESDSRTNTLIITIPETDEQQVLNLINIIDVEPSEDFAPGDAIIIDLKYAQAEALTEVLKEIITTGGAAAEALAEQIRRLKLRTVEGAELPELNLEKPIRIVPDEDSNKLVISSTKENLEAMVEVVRLLDSVPIAEEMFVRIYPLRYADAESLVGVLQELFEEGKVLSEQPGTKRTGPKPIPEGPAGTATAYNIAFAADTRTNTIVVSGRLAQVALSDKLITELDKEGVGYRFPLRIVRLEHINATELERVIQELAEQRVQAAERISPLAVERERIYVAADPRTNSLILSASHENYEEITELLEQLDKVDRPLGDVRIIKLKYGKAEPLAEKVRELWKRQVELRSVGARVKDEPIIVADERTNSLLVASSPDDFVAIQALAEQLETHPMALFGDLQIFSLSYADAVSLAAQLTEIFDRMKDSDPDRFEVDLQPSIVADERMNRLIVFASRDGLSQVRDLIAALDAEAVGRPSLPIEVYPLSDASAVRLAPVIQQMFEKKQESVEAERRTPIDVRANEDSNSLIVVASREDHDTLRSILELLDRPSGKARMIEIFPLKRAKAEQLGEVLEELVKPLAEDDVEGVTVTVDERANAVIVYAGPSDMENIRSVIDRLDSVEPKERVQVRVFQLMRADAEELAEILKKFLSGEEAAGTKEDAAKGKPPLLVSYEHLLPSGETTLRMLIRENVEIIPDTRANALIVVAPEDHMQMLESFIHHLDGLDPRRIEVRVFRLINADAETLVEEVLEPLFEPEEIERGEGEEMEITFGGVMGEMAGGRQMIAFTADARTNTVIAAGTPDYLEIARQIILQLDAEEIEERINRVINLKYAEADSVRGAIDEFYDAERQRLEDLGKELAIQRLLEREVSIVADEDTQSVLISVSPRYESELMEMINRLDKPPPQVLIQVLLAEVTVDDRFEMGLEFAVQDLLFSETNVNGLGDNFDIVVGTDLGAAGSGTALGGFSFTITGEDFNFLLRMLQTEGRLEVLSAPQIMAQDNQEANISVGNEVPFVRNVQVTEAGQINNTVEYEDVGIIMDVTPHINPDGFVRLEISPEISALSPSTVQISPGVNLPIIRKRSADTVVTVKAGESVVIGGLITSSEEETESKVPILGDIPILGVPFRATVKTKTKTELLIVVTPRVVRTVEDARRVSLEERDYESVPDSLREHPLMRRLQAAPGTPRVHPDYEPLLVPTPEAEEAPPDMDLYEPLPAVYGPPMPVSLGPPPAGLQPTEPLPTQGDAFSVPMPAGDPDRFDAELSAYLELRR